MNKAVLRQGTMRAGAVAWVDHSGESLGKTGKIPEQLWEGVEADLLRVKASRLTAGGKGVARTQAL